MVEILTWRGRLDLSPHRTRPLLRGRKKKKDLRAQVKKKPFYSFQLFCPLLENSFKNLKGVPVFKGRN